MNSKTAIIILGIVVIILLAVGAAVYFSSCEADIRTLSANLEFWGVFDNSDVYESLIDKFNEEYPNIKITYSKKDYLNYERDLINDLAAKRGPDIFYVQNTWLAKHSDKISPMEAGEKEWQMPISEFKNTFVDVAASDFLIRQTDENGNILSESVYALPIYVDTLALYWNRDLFNSAGVEVPPSTWNDFDAAVQKITKKDSSNNIVLAGAAMGTAKNVNRAGDILALLMMQTGAEMVNIEDKEATFGNSVKFGNESYDAGAASLGYYTGFANPNNKDYTWNNKQDYSIDAFSQGKVAMTINYSYHIPTIKAKQPYLKFSIAPVPQPLGAKIKVSYANYYGLAAAAGSSADEIKASWIFIKWLTQQAQAREYLNSAQRPTARRDLIDEQEKNTPELAIFARQSLVARSWYQVDSDSIDKIFNESIDAVNSGLFLPAEAIDQAEKKVTVLMQRR